MGDVIGIGSKTENELLQMRDCHFRGVGIRTFGADGKLEAVIAEPLVDAGAWIDIYPNHVEMVGIILEAPGFVPLGKPFRLDVTPEGRVSYQPLAAVTPADPPVFTMVEVESILVEAEAFSDAYAIKELRKLVNERKERT